MTRPAAAVAQPIEWPADNVQRIPVAALVPYARNARTHSASQVAAIAASIREWGWTTPVLVDELGTIIAGHGRVLAAQQLNILEIPVMVAKGWTDAQKKAYVIADNALPMQAGWDTEMLKVEIREIEALNFNIGVIGLDMEFMTRLFDAPLPAEERPARDGLGTPIIQFNIVFDDDAQQDAWFGFVRVLKGMYPDEETLGARLKLFITANT
jgi:hypothetical protein